MACANGISALSLPWTNVSVQASSSVLVRGVGVGVGTPAQSLSLWPSFRDNDTWVPNSLDCNNDLSNSSCIANAGGIYITQNSSTYKFASQSSWNGSQTLDGVHTTLNDNVQIADNAVIWGMPLLQHIADFKPRSALGLGPSSSFLKSLVDQKLAPSRTFGIWSGSQSVDGPTDGSLIVGGFDKSKVGTLTNFTSVSGCVACTVVTGLEVTTSSGSTKSLLNATVPRLNIQIDPYFAVDGAPSLAVPDEIRDMLVDATQAVWLPNPGVFGWPSGKQPGDVKIKFENGYQVTIPGNELWLPPRDVGAAGRSIIRNNSQIINGLRASGKYVPKMSYMWGQPFLSANYMIVWPDEGIWSLSPIDSAQKATAPSVQNLCADAVAPTPSPTPGSSSGSHTGAVVGGVVGGILGLLIVAAAIWVFHRRGKRQIPSEHSSRTELQNTETTFRQGEGSGFYQSETSTLAKKPWASYSGAGGAVVTSELPGNDASWRSPVEMSGSPRPVVELPDNHVRR